MELFTLLTLDHSKCVSGKREMGVLRIHPKGLDNQQDMGWFHFHVSSSLLFG